MKLKWVFCLILLILPVLQNQTLVHAANTGQIDIVLNKKVLDEQDKKIIDDYIREAINVLLNERDLANIARYRDAILARKGSQEQYLLQFNESTGKYLTDAFDKVRNITPLKTRKTVVANLLILIDGLKDVQFALLPMNKIEDDNVIVRYWAVHCLTNPAVIQQLNDKKAANPNLAEEISAKLKNIVSKSNPEILSLMAKYAANINIPQGNELLLQIADQRIKNYSDWTVREEFIDGNILKLLENKISNPPQNTDISEFAQRFAQLYSYVIQRYIEGNNILNENQKMQLVTVIVETEDKCIRNMIGAQQNLQKAIEDNQMQTLMNEHNQLFGSDTGQGRLPAKYGFNYGRTENGSIQTTPKTLTRPQ